MYRTHEPTTRLGLKIAGRLLAAMLVAGLTAGDIRAQVLGMARGAAWRGEAGFIGAFFRRRARRPLQVGDRLLVWLGPDQVPLVVRIDKLPAVVFEALILEQPTPLPVKLGLEPIVGVKVYGCHGLEGCLRLKGYAAVQTRSAFGRTGGVSK